MHFYASLFAVKRCVRDYLEKIACHLLISAHFVYLPSDISCDHSVFWHTLQPSILHCKTANKSTLPKTQQLAYFRVSSFRVGLRRLCELHKVKFIDDNKNILNSCLKIWQHK